MIETIEIDLEKLRGAFSRSRAASGKNMKNFSIWVGRYKNWFSQKTKERDDGLGEVTLEDLNYACRYLGRNVSEFLVFHQETVPADFCPAEGRTTVYRTSSERRTINP